jgi:hypothetical protein
MNPIENLGVIRTQTIISLLYIIFLEHNLSSKFRLVSSIVFYFKFRLFLCKKEMS